MAIICLSVCPMLDAQLRMEGRSKLKIMTRGQKGQHQGSGVQDQRFEILATTAT